MATATTSPRWLVAVTAAVVVARGRQCRRYRSLRIGHASVHYRWIMVGAVRGGWDWWSLIG